ncbi:DegT/DnrJ/EryC1/StrS family aminotransferase [Streptomyces sp. NPDC047049]|uniref:DegT/DnrJ/EryC1/StrS family aminotransferase n=1 Tax=Streptomyces sp. NPDC047049 TaxID=3156688 RepID=UPI0033FB358B
MPTDATTVPRTRAPRRWPDEPAQGGWYTDAEHASAQQVMADSLSWQTGWRNKDRVAAFEEAFADKTRARHAVAFNGGGTALEMVLKCLELQPGDQVISCALNFVGTHLPVIHQGGDLVLAEPHPLTLNLDPGDIEHRLTGRTRAILVTHWNGLGADLRPFLDLAQRHPHPHHGPPVVIVDAARACGGTTPASLPVGAEGWATTFSFETKKLMTTFGQGGMVTTGDARLAHRLRRLRTYGLSQEWGTNQQLSKIQAAVGLTQLARLDEMNAARISRAHERTRLLDGIEHLTLPPKFHDGQHLYYRYNLLVPPSWAGPGRDALMELLADQYGLGSIVNDPPTYLSHDYIRGHTDGQVCPRAEQLAARLLCPCLHPQIPVDEEREICDAIRAATNQIARNFGDS